MKQLEERSIFYLLQLSQPLSNGFTKMLAVPFMHQWCNTTVAEHVIPMLPSTFASANASKPGQ